MPRTPGSRRRSLVLVALGVASASLAAIAAPAAASADPIPVLEIVDGETAPSFGYADAIRERVFIPVPGVDQDGDGVTDRTAIDIIRPQGAGPDFKIPAIVDPSPYYTTVGRGNESEKILDRDNDGINDVWPLFLDNYFVPRGYAVILAQMDGTAFSTGCPMHGGPGDIASMRVVIDWLNGRLPGYDAGGDPVVADWHSGRAAMIGKSYDGTLANGVAATGVEGLTTIVPESAISNWYGYSRMGGIRENTHYPASLSNVVTNPDRRASCAPSRDAMSAVDGDDTGDVNDFWAERDYRPDASRVTASVLAVHGLNDDNVRLSQFSTWWEALAAEDVPRKLWLSQEGHVDPFDFRRAEWVDTLHRWFDYWLYGLDNGIMSEPRVTIETAPEVYQDFADWPLPGTQDVDVMLAGAEEGAAGLLRLQPDDEAESLSFTDSNGTPTEGVLIGDPETARTDRLAFLSEPLEADLHISGTPVVAIRAALSTTQSNLGAILVDYGEGTRVRRTGEGIVTTTTSTCWGESSSNDDACYREVQRSLLTTSTWRVTRGVLDSSNRDSLVTGEPVVPDQSYDFEWPLEPHDYVFEAGHRIGVVITTDVESFVVGTQRATVTLDTRASRIVLPVVGGLDAAAATEALGAPAPVILDFDLGGHGGPIDSQSVLYGEAPTAPDAPEEAGWTFDGWFADAGLTAPFDFSAPLTTDATAHAAWSRVMVTIDFDLGGHGGAVPSQVVEYGESPTTPADPAEAGWAFAGWYAGPARTAPFDFGSAVTADLTLHAAWDALTEVTGVGPAPDAILVERRPAAVTARVTTVDPAAPAPAGTVRFLIDGSPAGSAVALAPDGTATAVLPGLDAGAHTLSAEFSPAVGWAPSASGTAALDALTRAEAVDTIELALSATEARQGGSIMATVTGFDELGVPIGDVTDLATITSSVPSDLIEGGRITFVHASPHVITATLDDEISRVTVEVSPAAALSGSGTSIAAGLLVAALLVAAGALALWLRRRAARA